MWKRALESISLEVEHRSQDGDRGPTLRVRDAEGRERLRFDCFRDFPHFHYDPEGRDEISALDPRGDSIAWVLNQLRIDFAGTLERAGSAKPEFPPEALEAALDAAEAEMRNPAIDFDALDLETLRARQSEKWSTYDADVLPAWVAEMDFPIAEPIQRVLERSLRLRDFGYPIAPNATGLPEVFAARMQERFGWNPDPTEVEILACVVQGLHVALDAYSAPGDGVVVQTPIYPPFLQVVAETGRRLVENTLVDSGERFEIDFDALRRDTDARTRVILFCNPHNPCGRVFGRSELEALATLACERDWVVVSDEIHADLVFDGREYLPFASISPEAAARTVTLTSATKAFNIPGLRCGLAHFGTPELRRRFNQAHPRNARGGIGLLGLLATNAAWQHSQPWLDSVVATLDGNRRFVAESIARDFPGVVHHLPEATYLAWLDVRALDLGSHPAKFFLEKARVALNEGRTFGERFDGYVRLNYATSRELLGDILERMLGALAQR